MTQLVELQKHAEELAAAGVRIYAITYDPQPALASFASKHGITYQLLSDEGSAVIQRFGILNTLIDPDDPAKNPATGQRFYGIPFPGTYITDENGVVTEKHFFQSYEKRVSAGTILDRAVGRVLVHDQAPQQETREQVATITAFLADGELRRDVASTLYVRIAMDEGFHVYADPLPEGFVATKVEVGPVDGAGGGRSGVSGHAPARVPAARGHAAGVRVERADLGAGDGRRRSLRRAATAPGSSRRSRSR